MKRTINTILVCLLMLTAKANDDLKLNLEETENVFTSEVENGDTLTKRKIFEVDDHLVISDTIIIKTPEIEVKTVVKEKDNLRSILIPTFALLFAIIAIILKRKKNG